MNKQEFLAMSLPHGLKFTISDKHDAIIYNLNNEKAVFISNDKEVKPILHPLSDLTKPINGKAAITQSCSQDSKKYFVDLAFGIIDIMDIPFGYIIYLVKRHFDIAGLIEKGEAIDVNALDKNPYALKIQL